MEIRARLQVGGWALNNSGMSRGHACNLANAGVDPDSLMPCEIQNTIGTPNAATNLIARQTTRCGDCSNTAYGNAYSANTDTENTRIVRRSGPESVKAAMGSSHATYHGYSDDAKPSRSARSTSASS